MEENRNPNPEQLNEEMSNETIGEEAGESFAQAVQGGAKKPKKDWKKEVREWVISIAVALLVVFVIRTFFFQIIRVDGDSMSTTLLNGERLFVSVLDTRIKGVERGDIVICHYPNRGNTNFVKRVVAAEGDMVLRQNGVTCVVYEAPDENGEMQSVVEMLDERYGKYFPNGSSDDYEPYTLGENEYFVVGDNRYNSHDSRDWNDSNPNGDVGPITEDMIVGKVQFVFWPLDEIRMVE